MRWIYRHPNTRLTLGYSLLAANTFFVLSCASLLFGLNLFLGLGLGILSIGTWIGLELYLLTKSLPFSQARAKKHAKQFKESFSGETIHNLVKSICEENGLPVPYCKQENGEGDYFAAARSWPKPAQIFISDNMLFGIEQRKMSSKEIKSTLAHELAHIYYRQTFKDIMINGVYSINSLLVYVSLIFFGMTLLHCFFSTGLVLEISILSKLGLQAIFIFGICFANQTNLLIEGIISKATETQADFKGVELTKDPELDYAYYKYGVYNETLNNQKDEEENKVIPYISPMLHYFKRFYDKQPSPQESLNDIMSQFPETQAFEAIYTNEKLAQITKRRRGLPD
jgi:Zn-dependent protease with chaperone function